MTRLLRRFVWVAPCLVGAAGYLAVVGASALVPTNVGWLREKPDSLTHYLGWMFFRRSPWSMPIGLNPDYGLELGSSILYTDSIPLFALLFKPLSPWLPEQFQYTGMWLLACFLLQALFGWLLVGLATPRSALRLAGCALFVFAPPMLWRLAGHWALVGQWTILAALTLALRPGRRRQVAYWVLLEAAAGLVHVYLLAMVTGIWIAAWAGDVWTFKRRLRVLALELALVPIAVVTALWQAGLFALAAGKRMEGFGVYRFNLVAPINPAGWSRVLPDIPWKEGDYEGFAFLGLGVLLSCVVALHAAYRLCASGSVRLRREWLLLGLVLLGFAVFAASNKVGVGLDDYRYTLPAWLAWPAGTLRASGRLVWPAFYALLLAVVALIVRAYPARVSFALLTVVVATQVVDTSKGWQSVCESARRKREAVRSPLTSAFWYDAPAVYRRLRLVPPGNLTMNWEVFADYAARNGLATDAIYSARIDRGREESLFMETMTRLGTGTFDPQTFYILQARLPDVPCALDPARDQLAYIDGYWVLMPGWKTRFGERYAGHLRRDCPVLSSETGPLEFTEGSAAVAVLSQGWSEPEPWGTWSEGPHSGLNLYVRGPASALEFTATAVQRPGPPLQVEVSVDGRRAATWQVAVEPRPQTYRLALPDTVAAGAQRRLRVTFEYSDSRSPASLGQSLERRRIALGLRQARAVR
jgi:hypothetical protein